jgi:phosphate acyltransferase
MPVCQFQHQRKKQSYYNQHWNVVNTNRQTRFLESEEIQMSIVLDAMGSDKYPLPEVEAAVIAAVELNEEIILVGDEQLVRPKLEAVNKNNARVRLVHAPDVLEMGDKAIESAQKKRNNSMAVGLKLVKTGEARAFVTAGNTGAALFVSILTLGRITGVSRPGLTALFPVKNGGKCVVLDIGANVECRPDFLLNFAIMGSIYAQKVLKIANPRVALLSNGEEPGKGNHLVKETYPLLQQSGLNFIGNVEGKELFGGEADVVVTDGFTGNVLLKSSEAVAKMITDVLKTELKASPFTQLGAALAMPALKKLKTLIDPEDIGAAPLLGIDGLSFVGHGRSNARALVAALRTAHQACEADLMSSLRNAIQEKLVLSEPDKTQS